PLLVKSSTGLQRTQEVYICGFPLGKMVSNQVTISQAQVSNLHKENGLLKQVQLAGDMLPGNSGGPVVDKEGNVVGVSRAIYVGTRINLAVPGDYVHVVINGRLAAMGLSQSIESGHDVVVPVRMELINPLDHIKKVEVDVWI